MGGYLITRRRARRARDANTCQTRTNGTAPHERTQGAWEGSPLLTDPPANGAPCLTRMSRGILGGDADGRDAPDQVGLGAVGLHLITAGDPLDLAGGEVGAGSESRHRVGVVWFFHILQATPHQIRQGVCGCQTVTRSEGCHRYQ